MSDIGGVLGLFLGFAVMTFVEFIECFIDAAVWCVMWLMYHNVWKKQRESDSMKRRSSPGTTSCGSRELILGSGDNTSRNKSSQSMAITHHSPPSRAKNQSKKQSHKRSPDPAYDIDDIDDFGAMLYGVPRYDEEVRNSDIDLNVISSSPVQRFTYKPTIHTQNDGAITPVERMRKPSLVFR